MSLKSVVMLCRLEGESLERVGVVNENCDEV